MKISPFLEESTKNEALKYVDRDRREHLLSLKQEKNKAQSLAAGVLLYFALAKWDEEKTDENETAENCLPKMVTAKQALLYADDKKEIQVERTPSGKPYFADRKGLFFSLSHSEEYVACVLSDKEAGVDIQQEKKLLSATIRERILQKEECLPPDNLTAFFRLWASKEAFVKATGEGLKKDFRELCVNEQKGFVQDTVSGIRAKLYLFDVLPGYALALCILR